MAVTAVGLTGSTYGKPITLGTSYTLIHNARPGPTGTISGVSSSSGALFATSAAHGMVAGNRAYLSGFVTNTAYNGDWFIKSVPSTTSFRVSATNGGTVLAFGSNEAGGFAWTDQPNAWDEITLHINNISNPAAGLGFAILFGTTETSPGVPDATDPVKLIDVPAPFFGAGNVALLVVPGWRLQGGLQVWGKAYNSSTAIHANGTVNRRS